MRKMFTRLFGLTLLMYLVSSLTVVKAQCDLDPLTEDNVVLLTDITTKCDSALIQYAVTGFPSGTEFSFNGYGSTTPGGFGPDSTFWIKEGVDFTVQVRLDTCYSNVLSYEAEDLIVPVTLDTVYVTQPQCSGDQGELTVVTGGDEPFMVYYVPESEWGNTPYTAYTGTQFQAEPGKKYYIGVKSALGCDVAQWDSVMVNAAPTMVEVDTIYVAATDSIECHNGTGIVTVEVSGGGTAYSNGEYKVELLGTDSVKMTSGLKAMFMMPAGEYTAVVMDSLGCESDETGSVMLDNPEKVTFDISIVDVDCADSTNGVIYVHNFAGGTGTIDSAKVEGGEWMAAVNDTVTISGLTAGYYSVYVKQNTSCDPIGYVNPNNTQNTVAVQGEDAITFDVDPGTITCNGGTTTISVINVDGGSGSYLYRLEDENGLVADFSETEVWPVPAGDGYVVTVKDANAATCEISSIEYDITEPPVVSFDWDEVSPTCNGNTDGLIKIYAEGGNGTFQYKLDDGEWKDNNVFNVPAGTYTVSVQDPTCETSVVSDDVTVDPQAEGEIALHFGYMGTDTVNQCYGVNENSIVITKVTWPGDDRDISVYASIGDETIELAQGPFGGWRVDDIEPGTYTVWASDEVGCESNQIDVTISEVPMPMVYGKVTENATCYGENDGIITVWNNGGGNTSDYYYGIANTQQAANNLPMEQFVEWGDADSVYINALGDADGIKYYVVLMDGCGQRSYDGPFTVYGYDPVVMPEEPLSIMNVECAGESTGSFTIAPASGGSDSANIVYTLTHWGDVVGDYEEVSTTTFSGLPHGRYRLTAIDPAGCEGDDMIVYITEPEEGPVTFDLTKEQDISCFGAADGLIKVDISGGTPPYKYKIGTTSWQNVPASGYVNITHKGDVEVWVKDAYDCGPESQMVTIYEPTEITLDISSTEVTTSCDELVPDGTITVVAEGGNTGVYDIMIPGVDTAYATDSATFDEVGGGVWSIYVVEVGGNGCMATGSVTLIPPSALTASADVTADVSCNGDADGEITVSGISGGEAPYTISISPANGSTINQTTGVISNLPADSYTVTVTDNAGCHIDITKEVKEPAALTLHATKIQDVTCKQDGMFSVQVTGGTKPYTYYYAMSDTATGHLLKPDPEFGQADSIFSVTQGGTYIVWVEDAHGCDIGGEEDEFGSPVNEWRVKIVDPANVVTFDLAQTEVVSCNGMTDAELEVSNIKLNGVAYANVTITLDGDTVNSTISGLGADTYTVRVIDNVSGCSATKEKTISQPTALTGTLVKDENSFTCPDAIEGYLVVNATGGTTPYSYVLYQDTDSLNTYANNTFLVQIGHTYSVKVKDAKGCEIMTNDVEILPVAPVMWSWDDVTCSTDTAGSIRVTAAGQEGRSFKVMWKQVEEGAVTDEGTSPWFTESIDLVEVIRFDNEEFNDSHYEVTVVDTMGCEAALVDTITIDKVIIDEVKLQVTEGEVSGCGTEVTIGVTGGVSPYMVLVDGVPTEEMTVLLGGGAHMIEVSDSHLRCGDSKEFTLDYPMGRVDTVWTYTDETIEYSDVEAGLMDTTLYGDSTYYFYYAVDTACTNELVVVVNEKDRTAPVLDTMTPTGTIEDNHPVLVLTFMDDVTFTGEGQLTITAKDSTEASVVIDLDSSMFSGNTITVTYEAAEGVGLDKNTEYYVMVDSAAVMGDGKVWDGIQDETTWTFTTGADFATGITPDVETVEFKVYPNPFSDYIRIDNAQKLTRVVVSNIAGQRVLDIENPTYEIRTGNLTTGVYVVTLIANDEIVKSERIIKR